MKLGDEQFTDAAYYNAMIKASVNSPRVTIAMDAFMGSSTPPRQVRNFEGHLESAQQKNLFLLMTRGAGGEKRVKVMAVFDNFKQGQRFSRQFLKKAEGVKAKDNLNSALSHYVFIPRADDEYMDIQHSQVLAHELTPAHFLLHLPEVVNFARLREELNRKSDDIYVPELTTATQGDNPNKCVPVFDERSILHEVNERNLFTARKMMHKYESSNEQPVVEVTEASRIATAVARISNEFYDGACDIGEVEDLVFRIQNGTWLEL